VVKSGGLIASSTKAAVTIPREPSNNLQETRAIKGHTATFIIINVSIFIANQLLTRLRMHLDRGLICHTARREKNNASSIPNISATLRSAHFRIFLVNIISYFRMEHGV
jgi:hypothetical protein